MLSGEGFRTRQARGGIREPTPGEIELGQHLRMPRFERGVHVRSRHTGASVVSRGIGLSLRQCDLGAEQADAKAERLVLALCGGICRFSGRRSGLLQFAAAQGRGGALV